MWYIVGILQGKFLYSRSCLILPFLAQETQGRAYIPWPYLTGVRRREVVVKGHVSTRLENNVQTDVGVSTVFAAPLTTSLPQEIHCLWWVGEDHFVFHHDTLVLDSVEFVRLHRLKACLQNFPRAAQFFYLRRCQKLRNMPVFCHIKIGQTLQFRRRSEAVKS